MPIDTVAPGDEVTDIKTNEMIAAINSLQDGIGGPIVWGHVEGVITTTLTLSFGRWVVNAQCGAHEAATGVLLSLSINGTIVSRHTSTEDGGRNHVSLGGVSEINVTDETFALVVNISGSDGSYNVENYIKVMAHRVL